MILKTAKIITLTLLTTACSSSPNTPEFEEYLATNIRSDGGKEFYYTLTMSNRGNSKHGSGGRNISGGMRVRGGSSSNTHASGGVTVGGGSSSGKQGGKGGRGGNKSGSRPDEEIFKQLERKLLASGFCRDGWMETEWHIQPPYASIRGECDETATDADRQRFPNTEDAAG